MSETENAAQSEALPTLTEAQAAKVAFVRQHAAAFASAGWDAVTETLTAEQLAEAIGNARSRTGAVNNVREAVVIPWVLGLMETRPGSDEDPQAAVARALRDEMMANWYDATARLEGRSNTIRPPRKVMAALPAVPEIVEIDLTNVEVPEPAAPAAPAASVRRTRRAARKTA